MDNNTIEDGLNVAQFADPAEIKELMAAPDPDPKAGEQPEKPDPEHPDDELDDDSSDDEQRAGKSEEELEAATPEAQQAAREKKRQDRLNQRQRQRERIQMLERQLANSIATNQENARRLATLEDGQVGAQFAQLEQHEAQIRSVEQQLKDVIADATVKGDGQRVAEATQGLIEVRERQTLIAQAKQGLQARTGQAQARPQPLNPEVIKHAREFQAKATWYKGPKGSDTDSRVLSAIDNALTNEGWDASSPSYWTELEQRAKKYLPHRFEASDPAPKGGQNGHQPTHNGAQDRRPRSPVASGGSNNLDGGGESRTYRLNADRVRAMKEAGLWDDPKKRAAAIKRYQDYDKQHATS